MPPLSGHVLAALPPVALDRIPTLYRVTRVLTVVVCVPAALALIVGVLVPVGPEVVSVVQQREVGEFTYGRDLRGRERVGEAPILHTDRGEVGVSREMLEAAREGDTLLIQRGPFTLGVADVDQHVTLVRHGQVVREERPSDEFHAVMALFALIPVLSLRPYERWRDANQLKVLFALIPIMTLIMVVVSVLA